eukprot:10972527-Heterocapsa_arctica.AAC.1
MEPGICALEGTHRAAAYMDPGAATCYTGNTLDWYMVSGGLALSAESNVYEQKTLRCVLTIQSGIE